MVVSCCQKVDPPSRTRTMAVTKRVAGPDLVVSVRRLPGWRPNRAAVGTVAATATAPAGACPLEYDPATSCA